MLDEADSNRSEAGSSSIRSSFASLKSRSAMWDGLDSHSGHFTSTVCRSGTSDDADCSQRFRFTHVKSRTALLDEEDEIYNVDYVDDVDCSQHFRFTHVKSRTALLDEEDEIYDVDYVDDVDC